MRHHTRAPAPLHSRTYDTTRTQPPRHSHTTALPHSLTCAYAAAHLRHHSRASTHMPLRTSAPTSKQGCARSFGVSYPFLRSFTIIGMYLLYKFF